MKTKFITVIFSCGLIGIGNAAAQISVDESFKSLKAGQQAIFTQTTEQKNFAGSALELSEFSGVFGMASDTAYVLTAEGQARIGDIKSKPGEVIILTPYGGEPIKQVFDAERFLSAWVPSKDGQNADFLASLEKIRKKQKRAKFWGLYQPTNFNLAAPGSKNDELARRTIVGSKAIQNIRFSGETDPQEIERKIVFAFRDALIANDVETVASLMDPTPYGVSDLRGGADGARILMAQKLMKSKNWSGILANGTPERISSDGLWIISNTGADINIQMRPIGDFTYISSIEQGA